MRHQTSAKELAVTYTVSQKYKTLDCWS